MRKKDFSALSFGSVRSVCSGSGLRGAEGGKDSPGSIPPRSGAGRGRTAPGPPLSSGSAAGAEPARPRERSRSCRGAMALLPRRFLCFVLGKCGRRDSTSPGPGGGGRSSLGFPSAPAACSAASPLSLTPGEAPAWLRWRHSSRQSKGEMIPGRWDAVKHRAWLQEQ